MNYRYLLFNFGQNGQIKNELARIFNDCEESEVFITSAPIDAMSYLADNINIIFLFKIDKDEDYGLIHTILNKFKAKTFSKSIIPICLTDNKDLRALLKLRLNSCEFIYSLNYSPRKIKDEIDQILFLVKSRFNKNSIITTNNDMNYLLENKKLSGELNILLKSKDNTVGSSLQIDCLTEDQIVVVSDIMPSINFGTPLDLGIVFRYDDLESNVFLSGELESIETLDSMTHFLHLNITKFDRTKIEEFYRLYEQRQQSIIDFLALAKGFG